ncbi:MAG TPA: AbrB/MazE/SpoVT family DNA-binding domain-containing protein [Candidatus Nanoarchaeia archaeon]|nr:AbrB/MazE/SpoVT family DNA-binding domain-containing protein [Candidatus Nanoarchaeia archaeon]
MIRCHTRKWGNSLGLIIPKEAVDRYGLKPHEDLMIDVKGRVNVLKELFGSLKFKQPTDVVLKQARRELESKR